MEKEQIIGIDVCSLDKCEFEKKIVKNIQNEKKTFIVAINPEKIMMSRKDDNLKKILNYAEIQLPDGIGVVLASKLKKGKVKTRLTGIDCMEHLCEVSAKNEYKIFLFGAEKEVVSKLNKKLKERYPKIKIVGYIDGYQKNKTKIIKKINNSNPDILFVALGSPTQEYFITENFDRINATIQMGVGGSFDVLSGTKKRAPKFFRKFGLEWFYRLLNEPKRFFRQFKLFYFLIITFFSINKK